MFNPEDFLPGLFTVFAKKNFKIWPLGGKKGNEKGLFRFQKQSLRGIFFHRKTEPV
jgi:hypothetical protein